MTHRAKLVACATCGKPTRSEVAPSIRVFETGICYFCCREHADEFDVQSLTQRATPQAEPEELLPDDARAAPDLLVQPDEPAQFSVPESPPPTARTSRGPNDKSDLEELPPSQRSLPDPNSGRDLMDPPPLEFIPTLALGASTVLTLLPVPWAEGQFSWLLPLAFVGSLGLVLWERHDLKRACQGPRRYAEEVRAALAHPVALKGERAVTWTTADRVRPGQELEVGPGETLAVDGVIVSGHGVFALPLGLERHVRPGQTVLGGSRLIDGQPVTVRAQRVARDRALGRLLGSPRSSTVEAYLPVRAGRTLGRLGSALLGLLGAGVGAALGAPWLTALCIGSSISACLSSAWVHAGCYWLALDRLARLESGGTVFPGADVLSLAGHVGTAVFCARGTVQQGQPKVAEVHTLRAMSQGEILGLVAGALASVHHPIAEAVISTAQEWKVSPHACRSHSPGGGANMQCRSQDGREVTVGGREFLLRQRISIAWVEEKLRAIEAQAQTVLLVAEEDQLVGILALADDLAEGARATMQRLLSCGIEPALLSGDSRETTEALARRLHIDHVRPEATPTERRKEIEKLRTAGLPVAVVGRLGVDDASLLGADLPVLLGGVRAYSPSFSAKDEARSVAVWSGKLRDAGEALIVAHELKRDCSQFLLLRVGPTLLAVAATALLVVPPVIVPLLSWAGMVLGRRFLHFGHSANRG